MRIVSLLPSATEIVCALGLREQLVGVTHECDYPRSVLDLPKVTKTLIPHDADSGRIDELVREKLKTQRALYTLDMPVLEKLNPDLIVTQALCDVCAVAEDEVRAAASSLPGEPRVINLEPQTLSEVLDSIVTVGEATNLAARAATAVQRLKERAQVVASRSERVRNQPRTILLEWIDPPFSCGHWSPELVRWAGGEEQLGIEGKPSRTLKWSEVVNCQPEAMCIACCGFSIERTMQDLPRLFSYPGWNDLPCVRNDRVFMVNGSDYFSRPGPRLVDSLEMLAHALHPQVHELPDGIPAPVKVDCKRPALRGAS